MPSAEQISLVGQAYTYGRRTYKRLFQTTLGGPDHPFQVTQRLLDEQNERTEIDREQAAFCEVNWVRSQAISKTKAHTKEIKPAIRVALANNDRKAVLALRRGLAKERADVRDDLKEKGGILFGLNEPIPKRRSATRDAFILCLGFAEIERRDLERKDVQFDNWLAGRAVTAENVTAYLDEQGISEEKREDLEKALLGYVGAIEKAEREMAAS